VFSPFAHPLFTSMTGVGVGLAARSPKKWVRVVAPIGGYALAITLHGTWNLLASSQDFGVILAGYTLIMLPALAVMLTVAIVLRSREAKVVGRVLPVYAHVGWFTGQEIAALATISTRRAGRQWARRIAGPMGAKAMSDYQFAASKLAIIRDSLARGVGERGFNEEERQLLSTVDARRRFIIDNAQPGAHMPWATQYPAGGYPNYGSTGGNYSPPPNASEWAPYGTVYSGGHEHYQPHHGQQHRPEDQR
jgi:hypothetical protein